MPSMWQGCLKLLFVLLDVLSNTKQNLAGLQQFCCKVSPNSDKGVFWFENQSRPQYISVDLI